MAALRQSFISLGRKILFSQQYRTITVSPVSRLKEIIERKEGKTLILEGSIVPDPKADRLLKDAGNGACLLCSAGVDVKHTDVLILSQFLRSDGCLMPRRITGLCRIQHRRIEKMVAMAQKAGLMPNINPEKSKKDPKLRFGMKKFNVYYDEETIRQKYYGVEWRE